MEPYLYAGDFILLVQTKKLRLNDVVVFQKNAIIMIKRIQKITSAGIFVLGDNSPHSTDSRHFGLITEKQILGKILLKF